MSISDIFPREILEKVRKDYDLSSKFVRQHIVFYSIPNSKNVVASLISLPYDIENFTTMENANQEKVSKLGIIANGPDIKVAKKEIEIVNPKGLSEFRGDDDWVLYGIDLFPEQFEPVVGNVTLKIANPF